MPARPRRRAAPWKTITLEKHAGPVTAVLTVQRRITATGFFEFRRLRLVVRANGRHRVRPAALRRAPAAVPAATRPLDLQNVWGGRARGIVDIYTGGAHCCFETLIGARRRRPGGRTRCSTTTGATPATGQAPRRRLRVHHRRRPVRLRVHVLAASGLPVQRAHDRPVRSLQRHHAVRLDLVRADAKQWWNAYVQERGKRTGTSAACSRAWCADEYRLGEGPACQAELATALRQRLAERRATSGPRREVRRCARPRPPEVGLHR